MNRSEKNPQALDAIVAEGHLLPDSDLPLPKPPPPSVRINGGPQSIPTEKLAIGACFLLVAIGTAVATVVISKWEGELDGQQFARILDNPDAVKLSF